MRAQDGLALTWWKTTLRALFHADVFFRALGEKDVVPAQVSYLFLGGLGYAVTNAATCMLPVAVLPAALSAGGPGSAELVGSSVSTGCLSILVMGSCYPLLLIFVAVLHALMLHGALMILGGARKGYSITSRVVYYSMGAVLPVGGIPLIGCLAFLYGFVVSGIGLCHAHECEGWQAALAVVMAMGVWLVLVVGLAFAL